MGTELRGDAIKLTLHSIVAAGVARISEANFASREQVSNRAPRRRRRPPPRRHGRGELHLHRICSHGRHHNARRDQLTDRQVHPQFPPVQPAAPPAIRQAGRGPEHKRILLLFLFYARNTFMSVAPPPAPDPSRRLRLRPRPRGRVPGSSPPSSRSLPAASSRNPISSSSASASPPASTTPPSASAT